MAHFSGGPPSILLPHYAFPSPRILKYTPTSNPPAIPLLITYLSKINFSTSTGVMGECLPTPRRESGIILSVGNIPASCLMTGSPTPASGCLSVSYTPSHLIIVVPITATHPSLAPCPGMSTGVITVGLLIIVALLLSRPSLWIPAWDVCQRHTRWSLESCGPCHCHTPLFGSLPRVKWGSHC